MIFNLLYNDEVISSSMGTLEQIHYNAKLTMEANAAGTLVFSFPPDHMSYHIPQPMSGVISVTRDGEEIWCGRVISYTDSVDLLRTFRCEGIMAMLNDYPMTSQSKTYTMANMMLNYRNKTKYPFYSGSSITLNAEPDETPFEIMANYLKKNGGYFTCARSDEGQTFEVEYVTDDDLETSDQEIRLGDNIIDISTTFNPDYALSNFERSVSVKAFDRALTDDRITPFNVLALIHVISEPHGIDDYMMLSKMVISLDNPESSTITLGSKKPLISHL